jgi:hypothetical protein
MHTQPGIEIEDANNIKYFLIDQIYHNLSQYATGELEKATLQNMVATFRKYTDVDLDFIVKVFQAFVEYHKNGDVYYPPVGEPIDEHLGILP